MVIHCYRAQKPLANANRSVQQNKRGAAGIGRTCTTYVPTKLSGRGRELINDCKFIHLRNCLFALCVAAVGAGKISLCRQLAVEFRVALKRAEATHNCAL